MLKAHIINKVFIEATIKGYNLDPNNQTLVMEIEEQVTAVCITSSNYAKQVSGKWATVELCSHLYILVLAVGWKAWPDISTLEKVVLKFSQVLLDSHHPLNFQ